ncbi:MAG: 3-oxocholest-4-en-26-oyl-CoA dehydrogenase alpha subunit [Nocardioidaceae bacterium]|nr:3-oxocholest-4-en-26-oyl-CoA dehydrogenase alpha subunit [Nocardioidaceae bacterium]
MYIAYTPEQEALQRELRTYFTELMTPEVQEECARGDTGGPHCMEAVRTMGRDGWLGIGWPVEYGGQGRSDVEQFIFFDEAWRANAPIPFLSINTVGRTIMEFGSEEQKRFFLPKILQGELHFSIGYTEPGAGTDLASLTTRAVKDGDEWVINGQKIYTSLASYADYIWLAARTDPDAPKHKGITIFLVPTSDPGFSFTKIETMVNASTFNTYYDNVRVPESAVVADVNRGWDLIINQLNYERMSLGPPGMVARTFDEVVAWAQSTKLADGRRVIDQEWVQINLARVKAKLDFVKLINWKVAAAGGANPADSSATKVFATEFYTEAYRLLMEVVGPTSYLRRGSPGAVLAGRMERGFQGTLILTFGGGVNEVQRDLIALFGLGLPRIPRH